MVIKNIMRGFLLVALFMPALVAPTLVMAKESHLVWLQRMIDEHTVSIQQKVASSWALQTVPTAKVSSVVEVTLTMNGDVTAARVVSSSGYPDFDRSAEVAVTRSSPLPVAADPEVMDQFRTLKFEFRTGRYETKVDVPVAEDKLGYANYAHVKLPIYIDK